MTSVLLAEDDVSISDPLARALRREGYEVDVAPDGPSTLEAAMAGGVDLIVLDIGLPRLDGLEVCRRLRSEGHGVPVLILSVLAAGLVFVGATFGGSLVYDYKFNVESLDGSTVWDETEVDQLPADKPQSAW